MTRILAISLLSLTMTAFLFSQVQYQDVVYLKNGGITKGLIIEQVLGKSIKIETADGNTFVFTYEEIEKIAKEIMPEAQFQPEGYLNTTLLGVSSGEAGSFFAVNTINGEQIGRYFSVGLGIGYEDTPNDGYGIPLFLDFRGYLLSGQISPFILGNAGYSLIKVRDISGFDKGGFMLNAGAGVRVTLSPTVAFIIEASYRLQKAKEVVSYSSSYWDGTAYEYSEFTQTNNASYNLVMITAGIAF